MSCRNYTLLLNDTTVVVNINLSLVLNVHNVLPKKYFLMCILAKKAAVITSIIQSQDIRNKTHNNTVKQKKQQQKKQEQ